MANHPLEAQNSPVDPLLLPNEMPLAQALTVYLGRLLIFAIVILANVVFFAIYVLVMGIDIVPKAIPKEENIVAAPVVPPLNTVLPPANTEPAFAEWSVVFEDKFDQELDLERWTIINGVPLIVDGKVTAATDVLTIQPKGLTPSLMFYNEDYIIRSHWSLDTVNISGSSSLSALNFGDASPIRYVMSPDGHMMMGAGWQTYSTNLAAWNIISQPNQLYTYIELDNQAPDWELTLVSSGEAITAFWGNELPLRISANESPSIQKMTVNLSKGMFLDRFMILYLPREPGIHLTVTAVP